MSPTPPPSHQVLRVTWSVFHCVIVLALIAVAAAWYLADGQGGALAASWWDELTEVQQSIANSVRYPWDPS